MTAKRPTMPAGVDLDHDHEETRPVNGQRHEPWSEARGGKPEGDESEGAGSAPSGDGPAPATPDAGADPAPAEKRASGARADGESWLFARYVAEKIAEYEGRGEEPPQPAQEDAESSRATRTALAPPLEQERSPSDRRTRLTRPGTRR